ncbi:hypothetical protein Celaphus_00004660 [Cervus elaphus hippelaphus]|uniref:NAPA n=1 Tax=Cervus elaphus hippelaphus TaxID=46360 RepID=A0A212DC71_CEREH|nr:hypothetical protein Celaphus_00004660 [Cervus elaphus hippelaphus]
MQLRGEDSGTQQDQIFLPFFPFLFPRGSSKIEEACEIYARAANMFKMAKNWSAAGSAFCQAAQLHLQLQSKHDAATCFVDAGNAFKKADPQGEGLCKP